VRVAPTSGAIDESVDLAHEIFNRVFRKTYRRLEERQGFGSRASPPRCMNTARGVSTLWVAFYPGFACTKRIRVFRAGFP